jgi:hypothetical protein
MHILAVQGEQSLCLDAFEEAGCGPVVEQLRRLGGLKPKVDFNRMSLIGADRKAIG